MKMFQKRSLDAVLKKVLTCALLLFAAQSIAAAQAVHVVNIVPQSRSDESRTDSEPNLAVNPLNVLQMAASAFTPDPAGGANAPIYISTDGGATWALNSIVPGNNAVSGTGDITLRFGSTSGVLYAAILRGDLAFQLNILRTANFTAATTMDPLVNRATDDQPYVQALSVLTGGVSADHVYVGNNNISLRLPVGNTASVDLSQDAATAPAPAGFTTTSVEPRVTAALPSPPPPPPPARRQDGPSVRTAIHGSGVVYAAYFGWRTFGAPNTSDVVVARDNNFGASAAPFTDLIDAMDRLAGVRVMTGVQIPALGTLLGNQRIGSSLSIVVDPNNSQRVYLAWADGANAAAYTIHVRVSTDSGQNWGNADIRSVTSATNPSLAVSTAGKLGFLYQRLIAAAGGGAGTWETHLELTTDNFVTAPKDILLHRALDNVGGAGGAGPLGDYNHLLSVGTVFYGIFSANNTPDAANFPSGVTYQRRANFTTQTLLGNDGVTAVNASIDPFFFRVTESFKIRCPLDPRHCSIVRKPPLDRGLIKLKCPLGSNLQECVVFDPLPRNCLIKFSCPGCPPGGLCPPFYNIYFEGLKNIWEVGLFDGKGEPVLYSVSPRGRGVVLTFRPSKENFRSGSIGDYTLAFHLTSKGKRGVEYPIRTSLQVRETPYVVAPGGVVNLSKR
ncbi:MAG: hypothetical protein LAN84_04540 [Acidobacteriia bacterium]|nr:hypothetical protein [Terriglobia bacterium]